MHDPEGVIFELDPAHASLLELCARLLVQELDAEALQALGEPSIAALLEQFEPGVTAYIAASAVDPDQIEALAAEFCRLFLMSKATSPMLSVWHAAGHAANPAQAASAKTGGDFGAELAARARAWEDRLGIELAEGPWGNLPRDHLAVALGLLALALLRYREDETARDLCIEIHRDALAPGVPGFVAAVLRHSENPVYRGGAQLIGALVGAGAGRF